MTFLKIKNSKLPIDFSVQKSHVEEYSRNFLCKVASEIFWIFCYDSRIWKEPL